MSLLANETWLLNESVGKVCERVRFRGRNRFNINTDFTGEIKWARFHRQLSDSYILCNWSRNTEIVLNAAVINIRDFLRIYYEAERRLVGRNIKGSTFNN